jgi:hypothetical protein
MSDPSNPNIESRSTPQWALYQREGFWKVNEGNWPPFNTGMFLKFQGCMAGQLDVLLNVMRSCLDPKALEEKAKAKLSEGGWYVLALSSCIEGRN